MLYKERKKKATIKLWHNALFSLRIYVLYLLKTILYLFIHRSDNNMDSYQIELQTCSDDAITSYCHKTDNNLRCIELQDSPQICVLK